MGTTLNEQDTLDLGVGFILSRMKWFTRVDLDPDRTYTDFTENANLLPDGFELPSGSFRGKVFGIDVLYQSPGDYVAWTFCLNGVMWMLGSYFPKEQAHVSYNPLEEYMEYGRPSDDTLAERYDFVESVISPPQQEQPVSRTKIRALLQEVRSVLEDLT